MFTPVSTGASFHGPAEPILTWVLPHVHFHVTDHVTLRRQVFLEEVG